MGLFAPSEKFQDKSASRLVLVIVESGPFWNRLLLKSLILWAFFFWKIGLIKKECYDSSDELFSSLFQEASKQAVSYLTTPRLTVGTVRPCLPQGVALHAGYWCCPQVAALSRRVRDSPLPSATCSGSFSASHSSLQKDGCWVRGLETPVVLSFNYSCPHEFSAFSGFSIRTWTPAVTTEFPAPWK